MSSNIFITLMPYGRRIVYSFALVWAVCLFCFVAMTFPTVDTAVKALQRYLGLTALFLLYIVLLPGLLRVYFPNFAGNGFLVKIRRAIGVSLFSFAFLHVVLGFFFNLSGSIPAVFLLPERNQQAILFGFSAFIIFLLMAATSFDFMVRKLSPKRWKLLHRFIYAAGILVVFHAFFIGSHFTNPRNPLPLLVNGASLIIILLEIGATLKRLSQNREKISEVRFAFSWIGLGCLALVTAYFSYQGISQRAFDPHAEHNVAFLGTYEMRMATTPSQVESQNEVTTTMNIIDGATGDSVDSFQVVHEKLMHLIVLKSDLTAYQHLHPDNSGESFTQKITYPTDGIYNLYTEFQPTGKSQGIAVGKQQVGLGTENRAQLQVTPFTRDFGNYQVVMNPQGLAIGKTSYINFTIRDSNSERPVTDLEPYLGAFGHLVIVSEDTATFLHVHPSEIVTDSRQLGGPTVQFMTQFQKPGKYKLFLQFQHRGNIQLAEYVIEVK